LKAARELSPIFLLTLRDEILGACDDAYTALITLACKAGDVGFQLLRLWQHGLEWADPAFQERAASMSAAELFGLLDLPTNARHLDAYLARYLSEAATLSSDALRELITKRLVNDMYHWISEAIIQQTVLPYNIPMESLRAFAQFAQMGYVDSAQAMGANRVHDVRRGMSWVTQLFSNRLYERAKTVRDIVMRETDAHGREKTK
jgi:hypothetical protein